VCPPGTGKPSWRQMGTNPGREWPRSRTENREPQGKHPPPYPHDPVGVASHPLKNLYHLRFPLRVHLCSFVVPCLSLPVPGGFLHTQISPCPEDTRLFPTASRRGAASIRYAELLSVGRFVKYLFVSVISPHPPGCAPLRYAEHTHNF